MSAINDGGPAFPTENEHQNSETTWHYRGMSLRDYFAANAPDVPADFDWADGEFELFQRLIRWRFIYADAMIKAREGVAS